MCNLTVIHTVNYRRVIACVQAPGRVHRILLDTGPRLPSHQTVTVKGRQIGVGNFGKERDRDGDGINGMRRRGIFANPGSQSATKPSLT